MTEPRAYIVLLSHSNRPVDFAQCSLDALTQRYADPHRLDRLPPLQTLAALSTQRHIPAGLTVLRLTLDGNAATLNEIATFDPPGRKVQHAALVGGRLVVCLEDALLVFDAPDVARLPPQLDMAAAYTIDDPWFSGLHTVFATGPDSCIVSASAPDAVLEVDLAAGCVTARIPLPEAVYGHGYALTEADDLRAHYVSNDYQRTHINSASPDGEGGIVLSTLIQGDIGHLDAGGRYRVVSSGHVGCHAARTTADSAAFYFADSCNGDLVVIGPDGSEQRRFATGSRWLHDVQQVAGDLFLCCPGDRNTLELVDIAQGRTLLAQRFDARGGATQFVNIAPAGDRP